MNETTLLHMAGVFNCVVCSSSSVEETVDWLNKNREQETNWELNSVLGSCPHSVGKRHYLLSRERTGNL